MKWDIVARVGRRSAPRFQHCSDHSSSRTDETLLAQSAVDRFIHNAYDLVVEGESYRARLKPKVREDDPPPSSPKDKTLAIGRGR